MDLSIIPECYVDTNLIETICPPKSRYNHQKGCGTVATKMKKHFADQFAVGIIDKDKNSVDYLSEFDCLENIEGLTLHKHKSKPHYIIQIAPAIEQFLLNDAKKTGLDISDFDLPNELNELRKVSKKTNSKDNTQFKSLFKELIKSEDSQLRILKKWIDNLKQNPYSN